MDVDSRRNDQSLPERTSKSFIPEKDSLTHDVILEKKSWIYGFSAYTNLRSLFNTRSQKGQITCINGIRFWSMVWVLVYHSYGGIKGFAPVLNKNELDSSLQEGFLYRIVPNALPSVDSFFIIGGCLLTYLKFKELDRTEGKLNIPLFFLHRYIRITGVYAVVIFANSTLWKWTEMGPTTSASLSVRNVKS